jgi:hypothetical protein
MAEGAPPVALQHAGQLLAEGLAAAARRADQAADPHHHKYPACIDGDISHAPLVITVHARRLGPAARTGDRPVRGPRPHPDPLALVRHVLHDQRRQPRKHHAHKLVKITHGST